MKVGVTGTRRRITLEQDNTIWKLFRWMAATEFHHGDCTGADAAAHAVILGTKNRRQDEGLPYTSIIIHPPVIGTWRVFCQDYDEIREPLPYLERNHVIVDEIDLLIAIPQTTSEEIQSGTWATVRYARGLGKPVIIIDPDGGWRLDTTRI